MTSMPEWGSGDVDDHHGQVTVITGQMLWTGYGSWPKIIISDLDLWMVAYVFLVLWQRSSELLGSNVFGRWGYNL